MTMYVTVAFIVQLGIARGKIEQNKKRTFKCNSSLEYDKITEK